MDVKQEAQNGDSRSWLAAALSFLPSVSLLESQADTDVPTVVHETNSDINLEDLQRLQTLNIMSQQTQYRDARNAAIRELTELADAPVSSFLFRVLEMLAKFLAIERIPKKGSNGALYETLVFSAASALCGYCRAAHKNTVLNDEGFNDAYILIFPSALQWINFFHDDLLHDLTQDVNLRKNAWASTVSFLDKAIGNRKIFSILGDDITLSVVKLWVLEAEYYNNSFSSRQLPVKLLHKLTGCYPGQYHERIITSAMESLGTNAAQAAIHHLSSTIGDESHFEETRSEMMIVQMMLSTSLCLPHFLLSNGILRLLVKTLSYATRESHTDDPTASENKVWIIQNSCEMLQVMITRTTGVAMCRQALDFGILPPLLRADKWHRQLTPAHFLRVPHIHVQCLIQTLATYTIYPCVLRAAAIAIEKVPAKLGANLDEGGPMKPAWKQFKRVDKERIQVPGAPAGPFKPLICSNFFCPMTSPSEAKVVFKRCIGCGDALYCGPDCQSVDWKNHKTACKEMQEINDNRPTVPKEETDFAHKVALHELEHLHKGFILQTWRLKPNNHSPMTLVMHPNGSWTSENDQSTKIQVVILDYGQDYTSDKLRPTIEFTSAPMFEHVSLPTMATASQRYIQEWNDIKALADRPQKSGMYIGIVVIYIPEGFFTVQKFFSLLPYSIS
ncbi:hypothetical protein BT96DRAFT_928960 [Gymnopus androsaceus JB14]|uniref:MYND-type domain-containing protein n=1 Tax=Gymnopus androsaceus JB14 TaxID=1447944 RepID=A0A6A4GHK1_9AGAR|nr:hypothetical protein BT96DRAFT_928960 [Gymnopus androsaceus JB14]